jgi:hypothetical protein
VIFRRARFRDVIRRQLDLFERENGDVIADAQARLDVYNRADRDEAEELYGDYVDAVETGTDILGDLRDTFASTLDEDAYEQYHREFADAVARRFPRFALDRDG